MDAKNVRKAIGVLESIDPADEYSYEKAILAYLSIKKLPILVYSIPAQTPIFRTRIQVNPSFFENVSDILNPPNKLITQFGRCNRPFQSKFYASENRPTSFMELIEYLIEEAHVGDKIHVTIGRWELLTPLTTICITTPDKENRISDFDKEHGQALDKFIRNCDSEIRDGTIEFYRFLFDKFRKPAKNDQKTYLITSAYCNLALAHTEGNARGIYYPSVPFGGQGVNFALNSNFVTASNLKLTHVIQNEMTVGTNEIGKFKFSETGIANATNIDEHNGKIIWN